MLAMTELQLSSRTLTMDPRSYESRIDVAWCCTTVSPWIQRQLNTNVLEDAWISSMTIPRSPMFPITWCCSLNMWAYGTVYIAPGAIMMTMKNEPFGPTTPIPYALHHLGELNVSTNTFVQSTLSGGERLRITMAIHGEAHKSMQLSHPTRWNPQRRWPDINKDPSRELRPWWKQLKNHDAESRSQVKWVSIKLINMSRITTMIGWNVFSKSGLKSKLRIWLATAGYGFTTLRNDGLFLKRD